jgi:hypothetical protein
MKSGTNIAIQFNQVRVSYVGSCLVCRGWNALDITNLPVKSKYIGELTMYVKQLIYSSFYATTWTYFFGDLPNIRLVDIIIISVAVTLLDSSYIY